MDPGRGRLSSCQLATTLLWHHKTRLYTGHMSTCQANRKALFKYFCPDHPTRLLCSCYTQPHSQEITLNLLPAVPNKGHLVPLQFLHSVSHSSLPFRPYDIWSFAQFHSSLAVLFCVTLSSIFIKPQF